MSDPSLPYLAVGFGLFWAILAAYLVRLWVLKTRLSRRIERLEDRGGS